MNAASTLASLRGFPPMTGAIPVELVYATAFDLFQKEQYADAARVFRLMLRIAPTDGRGWTGLAECHEAIGQEALALEIFGAGTIAARSARCAIGRARLLRKRDCDDEAAEALELARSLAEREDDDALLEVIACEERGARP